MSGERGSALIWSEESLRYDFGPHHPLKPIRVTLTVDLIRASGLHTADGVVTLPRATFTTDDVLALHDAAYVEAVQRQSADPDPSDVSFGLGLADNPVFEGMHEAALEVCGASVAAADAVWRGRVDHAFNPAGGLHHAMPDRASGFCIYNDPAFAIDHLLRSGARRVAYIDVDTHHGDGVQAMFYDDPRVLTLSLHESGQFLFPGTGFCDEIGTGDARGTALNLPLSPATHGEIYLESFEAIVPPALAAFGPDALVTQLGCDTHLTDPLAHLALTLDDYHVIGRRLHELAHTYAGGRWVATGGGGYQIATIVPRAWTVYFAELAGAQLPHEVPWEWLGRAEDATGLRPPDTFTEGAVQVSPARADRARRAAADVVERLKRNAFDLLDRHG